MSYINFNGKILAAETALVTADNRGLRYGDGLFETILYKKNKFILVEQHLERLWKGLQLMQFDMPKLFTKEFVVKQMETLIAKNNHTHARVRLEIVRGNGGLYDVENMQPNYIIQSWQLAQEVGQLNSNGLQMVVYKDALKACDGFSNLKHNNYLPYFMGALFAKKAHCNDAVILNQHARICDTTIANIFLIKENTVYTPSLEEGCIAGTRRRFYLEQLPKIGFNVVESPLTIEDISTAEEVFLTNAINPIKWVASIDDHTLSNKKILQINDAFGRTFPDIFC